MTQYFGAAAKKEKKKKRKSSSSFVKKNEEEKIFNHPSFPIKKIKKNGQIKRRNVDWSNPQPKKKKKSEIELLDDILFNSQEESENLYEKSMEMKTDIDDLFCDDDDPIFDVDNRNVVDMMDSDSSDFPRDNLFPGNPYDDDDSKYSFFSQNNEGPILNSTSSEQQADFSYSEIPVLEKPSPVAALELKKEDSIPFTSATISFISDTIGDIQSPEIKPKKKKRRRIDSSDEDT